jgi:endonuclease III
MSKEKALQKVFKLHALYKKGAIKTLAQHEVNPGLDTSSRENFLYFTLSPCLNFQRSSPAMWQAALKTWQDPKTRYLFYPEKVSKTSIEKVQKDLLKYKLALQKNKHTKIWVTISKTLNEHFKNDPRVVLEAGSFDAQKVLTLVQKDQKKLFPYLSGPKMANYWLYILSCYTDMKLSNMNYISIIPDTHVIQCSIKLGIVDEKASSEKVAEAWRKLLDGIKLTPIDMHPVLWNWSRNDFLPAV